MKKFGRVVGIVLLVAGAAIAMAELLTTIQGAPSTLSTGAIWYRVHANSLVGFQGLIERGVSPAIWPPIRFVLTIPAWLLLVPPGLVLVMLSRATAKSR